LPERDHRASSKANSNGAFVDAKARLRFEYAAERLEQGDRSAALRHLKLALKRDPNNWIIRKQIWATEHPERFYDGDVDFAWQKQQLRAADDTSRDTP